jgi:hypothetical protein
MPQVKHYTAKREMKLDCGHTVNTGEAFHVTSVFTCDREGSWPLKILMACFYVARHNEAQQAPAPAGKPQEEKRAIQKPKADAS